MENIDRLLDISNSIEVLNDKIKRFVECVKSGDYSYNQDEQYEIDVMEKIIKPIALYYSITRTR
jgi:hypothetical protein